MTFPNTPSTSSRILWTLMLLGCSTRVEIAQLADGGGSASVGPTGGGANAANGGTGQKASSGGIPASAGGSGVTTGGSTSATTGGGPSVTTGGSTSATAGGGPGVTTGGSAPAATGGGTAAAAAGASTQFCAGDAKVNYKNHTYYPNVTHYDPLSHRNCCISYGVQLHTSESIGFDLFLDVSTVTGLRSAGDYSIESSPSDWDVAIRTSSDQSSTAIRPSGVMYVRGESPESSPWQLGACLTIDTASPELGGAQIFVPPVPMDYYEIHKRFAIWLLSDTSITAAKASELPLDSLTLASQPWLTLAGIDYIEQSTGWVALSSSYYDGELLRSSLGSVPLYGLPFVVTADEERIYLGGFFPGLSSVAISGPEIIVDFMKPEGFTLLAPFLGPTPVADPRNDPRITKVLKDTGRFLP